MYSAVVPNAAVICGKHFTKDFDMRLRHWLTIDGVTPISAAKSFCSTKAKRRSTESIGITPNKMHNRNNVNCERLQKLANCDFDLEIYEIAI